MIALESEGVVGARVNAFTVGQHVSVWVDLAEHGSVGHDLLLDVLDLLRKTEVNDFVEVVSLTALVISDVVIGAFSLRTSRLITRLW